MKTKLMALALLAGGSLFAQVRFSVGIGAGGYRGGYAPAYAYAAPPPAPGPGYTWVDGYRSNNAWIAGYWAPPRFYSRAYAVAPRFENRYTVFNRGGVRNRDREGGRDRGRENGFRGR